MVLDKFSDYGGSGSTYSSTSSWGIQESWPTFKPSQGTQGRKSSSFVDLVTGKCTLEDALEEFRLNGLDSPYNPDEDRVWNTNLHQADTMVGMGPSSVYLRQRSWPEPERAPAAQLPRPKSDWVLSSSTTDFPRAGLHTPAPQRSNDSLSGNTPELVEMVPLPPAAEGPTDVITQEQVRVLSTLPNSVLYSLLRDLEQDRRIDSRLPAKRAVEQECRFCKNNGERESYYRGHSLKSGGRVQCPVLRAFVCRRCGASGDTAHTIKYCPLSTNEERLKSAAMMRSVRMSGRRRNVHLPTSDYIVFGSASPTVILDNSAYNAYAESAPLDPLWAALERKLML